MHGLVAIVIALTLALGASVVETSAAEECMIGDSALCLANPNCHWDGEKRGCYPGPAQDQDTCAVHGDQAICDGDTSLGCKWSAEAKTCETKKN
jgi:hypothetical protein